MKLPTSPAALLSACGRAAVLLCLVASSPAQTPSIGTIEGRVFNPGTGEYLELARITVEGTSLETFTDSTGRYRLTNVPAGPAKVIAFRTGVTEQTQSVLVAGGQTVQQDFNLTAFQRKPPGDGAIVLDEFVVASSKEMDNAVLAINTQRFAPNVMNVVAADEFGGAAESKVGEVLKSLPGGASRSGPSRPTAILLNISARKTLTHETESALEQRGSGRCHHALGAASTGGNTLLRHIATLQSNIDWRLSEAQQIAHGVTDLTVGSG